MKPSQVKALIEAAIEHPAEMQPIWLEGQPGIGKSAIVREVTEDKSIGFLDSRLAQQDPTDMRGIPAIENGRAKWLAPSELPTEGQGIWILDELSSAPPLVQASAYQLTLDRRIGEYRVPDGWYIIAAGNRLKDRAIVQRISTALANRFSWINFEPDLDDWINWAMRKQINPNIIGFIKFKPDLLAPEYNAEADEKAFPTPRTWEFTSRALSFVRDSKVLHELIEGTIGRGATAEFMAFLKVQTELPDLNDIFNGKDYVPPENRMDLRYALVSGLATRAKGSQFERMLQYSYKLPAEFGVMLIQMLAHRSETDMAKAPSFGKWAREHSDIIIARKKVV